MNVSTVIAIVGISCGVLYLAITLAEESIQRSPPEREVYPPGATLAEILEERVITPAELASMTGLARGTITGILAGTEPLTPKIADQLEEALGAPAHVWLNLEASWRRNTP